jgi:L-lactate dehydrogenase (cytochrome)
LEVLYQIRQQHPEILKKAEFFIDGGIRRGTDVLKALCLGAKAVGLGRPFLYAQSAYGEEGVKKLISIFARELTTDMKLLGVSRIEDLTPDLVGDSSP